VGRVLFIDGTRLHQSAEFEGERYSIVAFYHSSSDDLPLADRTHLEELGFCLRPRTLPLPAQVPAPRPRLFVEL
jgi:hypothetical protein